MRICSLLLAAGLIGLASCASPLNSDVPRVDTRVYNAVKIREMSVNTQIALPTDTTTVPEWPYTAATQTMQVNDAFSPPHVGMDCVLRSLETPGSPRAGLKELRIRFEDAPAQSTVTFNTPGSANRIAAVIVVDGQEQTIDSNYTASAVLHYTNAGKREIRGTLFIGANRGPAFTLAIAVNFTASED